MLWVRISTFYNSNRNTIVATSKYCLTTANQLSEHISNTDVSDHLARKGPEIPSSVPQAPRLACGNQSVSPSLPLSHCHYALCALICHTMVIITTEQALPVSCTGHCLTDITEVTSVSVRETQEQEETRGRKNRTARQSVSKVRVNVGLPREKAWRKS